MEESKKGGARSNAGRKPTGDPKMPITVYIETSIIQKNGGKVELAQRIIDTVKSDFVVNPIMERVAENNKPKNKERILKERNTITTPIAAFTVTQMLDDQIKKEEEAQKHPLYKKGDPREGSNGFFLKYECWNYQELEEKLKP